MKLSRGIYEHHRGTHIVIPPFGDYVIMGTMWIEIRPVFTCSAEGPDTRLGNSNVIIGLGE